MFACVLCLFLGKMTAQEQMKKMLDELMGTQRDENSVVMSVIAQSSGVSFSNLCLLCFVLETYHFKLLC